MEIIETTAPISIDELKKFFVNKDTKYIIEYNNSKLQGTKLLTYLSNLDIPCDLKIEDDSTELFTLLTDYLNCPLLVNIESLEKLVMEILFVHKGLFENQKYTKFIEENKEILDEWSSALDSCTLYNMYCIKSDEFVEFVKSHPESTKTDTKGINFVNLLKYEVFYAYYDSIDVSNLKYYPTYFNDYMFKGKNLYYYWATAQNPLFLLTHGIASGIVKSNFTINEDALV
jgi:hypothetical protein